MILRDWRDADAALMQSCYDREQRSWLHDLGWDTTWTWTTVEQARVSWGLPGRLACDDDGTLLGWAFSMRDAGAMHIGGLVASSPAVTAALLDALIAEADPAADVACFVRDRAPGLVEALAARGLAVEHFHYLARPLSAADACPVAGFNDPANAWRDADFVASATLLQKAYSPDAGRHFAPSGTFTEWGKYLSGVVQQAGCGLLDRTATRVARDGGDLQALALVTSIGPGTMHLAQLAVHPSVRGCGVATRLLRDAIACAGAAGATEMTLLVGEHNQAARRLYASLGFAERATFVAARTAPRVGADVDATEGEHLTSSVC
jgi:ribosomal protein S18 acetylase RimI-like enzyme